MAPVVARGPQDLPKAHGGSNDHLAEAVKSKSRKRDKDALAAKRRCVSSACTACRRRKSKCDGNTPSCAACSSVYGTECVYDPSSDHRRKGVYKKDIDSLKTRNSTLQTLIQAILSYPEDEVMDLVKDIRACENLDDVAENITSRGAFMDEEEEEEEEALELEQEEEDDTTAMSPKFEKELAGKMGGLRLENGEVRFLGGTSNLLYGELPHSDSAAVSIIPSVAEYPRPENAIRSWTTVTDDVELIFHLLNLYFTWHYTYFTTLSKYLFLKDFFLGKPAQRRHKTVYCSPLLVNAMLALGCHFTTWPESRSDPSDSGTAGDHFFKEAKRLIFENDEFEHPRLATVQALALMSVREAGCAREAKGWSYSGMSFRMALDLGLNVDSESTTLDETEIDARRITFWGCFLFDKCWSNYLGRPPQLPLTNTTVSKPVVFPAEDSEPWIQWSDMGPSQTNAQPGRTRAVALQISLLCEISNDLILDFYRPTQSGKSLGKQAVVKKLSDLQRRLEGWRKALPKELEPREGQLPNVLVMHMFFNLLFIHLFRPFFKYSPANSPLPSHVSPRKNCTAAAVQISKLFRLYKRTHGLRQICNIAVYIGHMACTIHLLNIPDKDACKDARRDVSYMVKHLEEIAEMWLCARRTLAVLSGQVRKYNISLPDETAFALTAAEARWGDVSLCPQPRNASYFSNHSSPGTGTANHSGRMTTELSNAPAQVPKIVRPVYSPETGMEGVRQAAFHREHQGLVPAADKSNGSSPAISGANRTPTPNMASPVALFGSAEANADENRDWWLRDQSSMFDQWSKNGEPSIGAFAGVNLPASDADNGVNAMASIGSTISGFETSLENELGGIGDLGMVYGIDDSTTNMFPSGIELHNTEHLDFGSGNGYGAFSTTQRS